MSTNPIENLANIRHEFGEHGGVNMSIEASTTFTVMSPDTLPELFGGQRGPDRGCYLYGRHFNPTVYHLGRQLAAMEQAEAAYCTASGMAAISSVLLRVCDTGDHIVASRTIYGGTYALLHDFLPKKAGIATSFVDVSDMDAVAVAITPNTRALYVETLSNPTLRVADIEKLAETARSAGIPLIVDNTFSPLLLQPIALGADIVVHSVTKFISGASDIIAGAICGRQEFIESLMDTHEGPLMVLGPTIDPAVAHRISLRIPHLALRMAEHGKRALYLAEKLAQRGLNVNYPGLPSHPDHELFEAMRVPDYGFGGILTLDLETEARANTLMDKLQNEQRFGYMAVSLGYFDTLMSCSSSSTSSEMTDEDKKAAQIRDGLVRVSVGYTGTPEQRWKQLATALDELD